MNIRIKRLNNIAFVVAVVGLLLINVTILTLGKVSTTVSFILIFIGLRNFLGAILINYLLYNKFKPLINIINGN